MTAAVVAGGTAGCELAAGTDRPATERDQTDHSIAGLFVAARGGDRRALDALVIEVLPMMRRTAQRHATRPVDVDDIVQEALAALLTRLHDVRSPAAVEGWLWRVTVNAARTIGRRHRRLVCLADAHEAPTNEWDEDPVVDRDVQRERSAAVREAIYRLDPSQRRLLTLLTQETSTSYAEVGQLVGCPVGTIGPSRQRAIARLRSDPAVRRLRDAG